MLNCTKWWGEDRHVVIYPVKPDRSEIYFVTSQPEPGFELESWSATGDVKVLREAFEAFHPEARAVINAAPEVHKRPLVDRDPLERWVDGKVALLGDACHPMTPYMAQGAAMAIEDAAILSRCLAGVDRDGIEAALAPLRGDAQGADLEDAVHLAPERLGQGRHRRRLGLRLQRLGSAAGAVTSLASIPPRSQESRDSDESDAVFAASLPQTGEGCAPLRVRRDSCCLLPLRQVEARQLVGDRS